MMKTDLNPRSLPLSLSALHSLLSKAANGALPRLSQINRSDRKVSRAVWWSSPRSEKLFFSSVALALLINLDITWKEISQCSIGADLVICHKTYSTLRAHIKINLSIIFAGYFYQWYRCRKGLLTKFSFLWQFKPLINQKYQEHRQYNTWFNTWQTYSQNNSKWR